MNDLSLAEYIPLICEVLAGGGEFRLYPHGTSMLPLLREGKDSVILVAPRKPRRGDILLYRRPDGSYILHRLVKLRPNGDLVFSGDNHMIEEEGIGEAQILAAVSAVYRGEKRRPVTALSQRLYTALMTTRPLKRLIWGSRRLWSGLIRQK